MCQLLGISSNKEANINFSLQEFQLRADSNPHGWGLAYYKENNWKLMKSPNSLKNERIENEKFNFQSKITVGHVRDASCGAITQNNTHPFVKNGWTFAHNGTVSKIINHPDYPLYKFLPGGETDSEYAFCYLLGKIADSSTDLHNLVTLLRKESDGIKDIGNFNYLLSNGEYLFAYGDSSLYFTLRKSPFTEVTLRDKQYSVNLGEIMSPNEKSAIIATERLTDEEKWEKINGLKVFKDGELLELNDN